MNSPAQHPAGGSGISQTYAAGAMDGPFMMLLSAAIFGYFGFGMSWAHKMTTDDPPELLIMVALLEWTLKVSAVGFLVCGLLTGKRPLESNLMYALLGLASAVVFAIVGIWDYSSPYYCGVSPVLLLIFAAWNGYGSFSSLQVLLVIRRRHQADPRVGRFEAPDSTMDGSPPSRS